MGPVPRERGKPGRILAQPERVGHPRGRDGGVCRRGARGAVMLGARRLGLARRRQGARVKADRWRVGRGVSLDNRQRLGGGRSRSRAQQDRAIKGTALDMVGRQRDMLARLVDRLGEPAFGEGLPRPGEQRIVLDRQEGAIEAGIMLGHERGEPRVGGERDRKLAHKQAFAEIADLSVKRGQGFGDGAIVRRLVVALLQYLQRPVEFFELPGGHRQQEAGRQSGFSVADQRLQQRQGGVGLARGQPGRGMA